MLDIQRCLTISTAHIKEDTAIKLDREPTLNNMCITVYKKLEYGYWIYCPEDMLDYYDNNKYKKIPEDLWNCMLLAHKNNCEWLCLDCDEELIDELEVYEW